MQVGSTDYVEGKKVNREYIVESRQQNPDS